MRLVLWIVISIILILSGMQQFGSGYTDDNIGVKVGDRLIHELVRHSDSSEYDNVERQVGVIEITEIISIPNNIGNGNDTIITSFERKYEGKRLYYYENKKNNISHFTSNIIHTNWSYWKNHIRNTYNNDSVPDTVLYVSYEQNDDTFSFSVWDVRDISNATHEFLHITEFNIVYDIVTGMAIEYSWINGNNITFGTNKHFETNFEIKFIRILNEPNYAISDNEDIYVQITYQILILITFYISKFRKKTFTKITNKSAS